MSENLGKEVLAKLENLERAVTDLRAAFSDYIGSPGKASGEQNVSPGIVPVIAAAEAVGQSVTKPRVETVAPAPLKAMASGVSFIEVEDGRIIQPPAPEHGIDELLKCVFAAAMLPEVTDAWRSLEHLTHSEAIFGPRSLEHLKGFNWRQLRKNSGFYLRKDDPTSFRISRTQPEDYAKGAKVKVFIHHLNGASPAPIFLERDEKADGAWRVVQYSL
jgi:hypothetical protein